MMWARPLAGRETAHAGQPGQPTSARAHARLTSVSEPGCEKLRMVFKGFVSHCLGDKKTQDLEVAKKPQPMLKILSPGSCLHYESRAAAALAPLHLSTWGIHPSLLSAYPGPSHPRRVLSSEFPGLCTCSSLVCFMSLHLLRLKSSNTSFLKSPSFPHSKGVCRCPFSVNPCYRLCTLASRGNH